MMCLQCLADAQHVFKGFRPILPKTEHQTPFYLVRARTGCEEWPNGWFGLVIMNDPVITWEWEPIPEPPEDSGEWIDWYRNVEPLEEDFCFDPMTGFQFVSACMEAGYDPEKHGYNVLPWFMNHVGVALKEWELATEEDWDPAPTKDE